MSCFSPRYVIPSILLIGFLTPSPGESESTPPEWGLPESMLDGLARQGDAYRTRSYRFTCLETVHSVRYRPERSIFRKHRYAYVPGGIYRGMSVPEFRLQIDRHGRVGKPARSASRPFPTPDEWTQLFAADKRPLIIYRDLGVRLDGFDLVREIEFRGWLPFRRGSDIREWEGVARVEAVSLRLVSVRARPRNQEARLPALYDRWARSWKITLGIWAGPWFLPIKTFRTARRPLAFHALVRFDHHRAGIRLPSLLRYETHRAVSRNRTEARVVSTRLYESCHAGADETVTPGQGTRRPG